MGRGSPSANARRVECRRAADQAQGALTLDRPDGRLDAQGFIFRDETHRRDNVQKTLDQIDLATRLGIPTMRINTGRSNTIKSFDELMDKKGIEPPLNGVGEDEAFGWVIGSIEKLLPRAEEASVVLGLENHWDARPDRRGGPAHHRVSRRRHRPVLESGSAPTAALKKMPRDSERLLVAGRVGWQGWQAHVRKSRSSCWTRPSRDRRMRPAIWRHRVRIG
jgi:hypothetical protein